jgi:excisionase family DNA binding protein
MEYVNIMEAARRCQVSDKTVRRWIHAHKLPARFPHPNHCEIALGDLEPFLPGHLLSRLHFTNDQNVDDVSSPLHFPTS